MNRTSKKCDALIRCEWCSDDPLYVKYHDEEWGEPVFDEGQLFEMLILEGAQAGLSWITILRKRENYRSAFDDFDPIKISRYQAKEVATLLGNPGIVRNRLKVAATITNAQIVVEMRQQGESFSDYLWSFVDGTPVVNSWESLSEVPATSQTSDAMSKDLKKRGFKFVGSTICYAFMQATGMVNDHTTRCHRHPSNLSSAAR